MMLLFSVLVTLLPLYLSYRIIAVMRKMSISDFIRSMVKVVLIGVMIVSISVTLHHFKNMIDGKANMSIGVFLMIQGIISGILYLFIKVIGNTK